VCNGGSHDNFYKNGTQLLIENPDLLQHLKGVKFTRREIECIAFFISGRSAKTIASFFSISPKTVDAHTHNIMVKLSCNSRESIINFIEQSGTLPLFKKHYADLQVAAIFEKCLHNISRLNQKEKGTCFLLEETSTDSSKALSKFLAMSLEKAGLSLSLNKRSSSQTITQLLPQVGPRDHLLYIISQALETQSLEEDFKTLSSFKDNSIFFLVSKRSPSFTSLKNELKLNLLYLEEYPDHHLLVFEILKRFLPSLNLEQIISDFKTRSNLMDGSVVLLHSPSSLEEKNLKPANQAKSWKTWFLGASICMIGLYVVWMDPFTRSPLPTSVAQSLSVHSSLLIPPKKVLLQRDALLEEIDEKLKETHKIQKVALIGIEGAGKTTLARHYARQHKENISWEINSETHQSLLDSFEKLASALAETEQEKKNIREIQEAENPQEKEEKIVRFVQAKLREYPNWLLIYDNVEKFSDLQQYFPHDSKIWGQGKVILTTRNSTFQNSGYPFISLGELQQKEKLSLFKAIITQGEREPFTETHITEATHFLDKLPSFPLDVSAAAYYLKTTHSSYESYLQNLGKNSEEFRTTQVNLLKETGNYTKTRYGIITLSLKNLIEAHKDFSELLLLFCLLDSQNIPKDLLTSYKEEGVVDNFILHLKKYSLVISETPSTSQTTSLFSIHRSMQSIGKAFLLNVLSESEIKDRIDKIITSIEAFTKPKRNSLQTNYVKYDCSNILQLGSHLEVLKNNLGAINLSQALKDKFQSRVLLIMAYGHHKCTSNRPVAKEYFLKFLEINKNRPEFSNHMKAVILKELGDNSLYSGHMDEGLRFCQKSIDLSKNNSNSESLVAKNLDLIGVIYSQKRDFLKANHYFQEAIIQLSKTNSEEKKIIEAKIYRHLARLYSQTYLSKDKEYKAEKYALKALELLDVLDLFYNDPKRKLDENSCYVARHKAALGQVYNRLGKYEEAMKKGFREADYIRKSLSNCPKDVHLKARISLGIGEVLLRRGQLKEAEAKLTESIQIFKESNSKSSAVLASVLRAEARIRLDKFDEAYEDCSYVFKTNKKTSNNYFNLLYYTCFYHAAFIKYKKGDIKTSAKHFLIFFKNIKEFCKLFLEPHIYDEFNKRGVFTQALDINAITGKNIREYLAQSAKIFPLIYEDSHPFVQDYVLKN
jgi:DNA-binding CsgD family transcriptional regulator